MTTSTCYLESVDLRLSALNWLTTTDPQQKVKGVSNLQQSFNQQQISLETTALLTEEMAGDKQTPGRPNKPELVSPLAVKKRSMRSEEGRAALIHALTHIEFNAINLALDAIWHVVKTPNSI